MSSKCIRQCIELLLPDLAAVRRLPSAGYGSDVISPAGSEPSVITPAGSRTSVITPAGSGTSVITPVGSGPSVIRLAVSIYWGSSIIDPIFPGKDLCQPVYSLSAVKQSMEISCRSTPMISIP